ncbi:hypothetical protein SAMN05421820_115147 [Pedobacter steynii]|uniref:Uncharacterized protein n=1 Tax=Pedobacter steynii TaxID=430522 RepID=A0A1H0K2W7_9SPHI|nr:hypothetical protein [Pedobacter steynii]NQX43230.1 hypothetical protein [Pedobacter steynii]SDO50120.1 hypothetical protein SAMN05421820_115147 [Pedobacter steynii]
MNTILEQQTIFKALEMADLSVGDKLVNLGEILEIEESDYNYSLVIARMGQRQVWTFHKESTLFVE